MISPIPEVLKVELPGESHTYRHMGFVEYAQ